MSLKRVQLNLHVKRLPGHPSLAHSQHDLCLDLERPLKDPVPSRTCCDIHWIAAGPVPLHASAIVLTWQSCLSSSLSNGMMLDIRRISTYTSAISLSISTTRTRLINPVCKRVQRPKQVRPPLTGGGALWQPPLQAPAILLVVLVCFQAISFASPCLVVEGHFYSLGLPGPPPSPTCQAQKGLWWHITCYILQIKNGTVLKFRQGAWPRYRRPCGGTPASASTGRPWLLDLPKGSPAPRSRRVPQLAQVSQTLNLA